MPVTIHLAKWFECDLEKEKLTDFPSSQLEEELDEEVDEERELEELELELLDELLLE